MRSAVFVGALVLALILGAWSLQVPAARPIDAPATAFSAERAMVDLREIAQRPHPVSSADHARVRAVLIQRLEGLGLEPTVQTGRLVGPGADRLEAWGGPAADAVTPIHNIVGRLPGRDPSQPAVAMMAHYDTTWTSPGAADDTTGVAAILEAVRAIQARGPAERDLIVVLTDAEELNLDGARLFFEAHPRRDRIGAVVNLEARGGGGRAMMFETGRDNAGMIDLFARAAARAEGGTTTSSLAGYVYALMPNGTDFTVARERGIAGTNFAFQGRPSHYHTPASTPEALDVGSVQHIGSQALETADALVRAQALPVRGPDRVYSDLLGRLVVQHPPLVGWILLAAAVALLGFACWRADLVRPAGAVALSRGVLSALWFVATGVVAIQAVRVLAGPVTGRVESPEAYYILLARLPWMEAASGLTLLAVTLIAVMSPGVRVRRAVAALLALATLGALAIGGPDVVLIGLAVVAIGLTLWSAPWVGGVWGRWLGLIALILILGGVGQAVAPQAAYLLIWSGLVASAVAAFTAVLDHNLTRRRSLVPGAVATVLVGAWLAGLGHAFFLSVGMDLPGVLAVLGLLLLAVLMPLAPKGGRSLAIAAAASLVLGCGLSLAARVAEPLPVIDAQ